jgi:hypothetical protein
MALAWKTKALRESEVETMDVPRPLMGPIADPVGQGSVTPPVNDASSASSLLDLITAIENDIVIRGPADWQALGTGAMGRSLIGTATATTGRGLLDVLSTAEVAAGYQPLDADLTAIAALTTTTFGRSILTEASVSSLRTTLGAGVANGLATLDSGGKVPLSQISDVILGQVEYIGAYNATTNSPTLANPPASTTKGDYYVVSVAGTQFGLTFAVGDWIISNGTAWEKVDNTDQVTSVAGRIGAVTLGYADITDLASWTGSSGITTLGTITTGVWHGTAIADGYIASATTWNAKEPAISAGTTAQYWRGDKSWQTLNSTAVGLGNVENTALSTWAGSANLTTLKGTVTAGSGTSPGLAGITIANGAASYSFLTATDNTHTFIAGIDHTIAFGKCGMLSNHDFVLITNNTERLRLNATTSTFAASITTANPQDGAGAWLLGQVRVGVALAVSAVTGLQVKVDGTLFTLAVLTTNP